MTRAQRDDVGRVGDWMETYSGLMFWPLDPRPAEVRPIDVAHHLSMICRYNGASRFHYSVAQHSVLLSDWCLSHREELPPEANPIYRAKIALMHDAAEAYFGDVIRPVKSQPQVRDVIGPIERGLEKAVYERFGMPMQVMSGKPDWMKDLEVRMAITERGALMTNGFRNHWTFTDGAEPLDVTVEPWDQLRAYGEFSQRMRRLFSEELLSGNPPIPLRQGAHARATI